MVIFFIIIYNQKMISDSLSYVYSSIMSIIMSIIILIMKCLKYIDTFVFNMEIMYITIGGSTYRKSCFTLFRYYECKAYETDSVYVIFKNMAMSEKTVVDRKSGQKYTIVGESPKGCLKYYTCNPSVDTPLIRAIKSMMG